MFKRRTLFIVGAGAAEEVGMPLGSALREQIPLQIFLRTDPFGNPTAGSREIFEALLRKTRAEGDPTRLVTYAKAGERLCTSLPLASSIDNVLDAFKDDAELTLMGKLGIVDCILRAERNSILFPSAESGRPLNLHAVGNAWLNRLWHLLCEGVSQTDAPKTIFNNVAFIIFNYDRCVEHFLRHSLATYYHLDLDTADKTLKKLHLLHPYGSLGTLADVPFGSESTDYLKAAGTLRTFTERIEDERALLWMAGELASAEVVVYLGFAFHPQNMELLKRSTIDYSTSAYATTFGLSHFDRQTVAHQIVGGLKIHEASVRLSEKKCVEFFDEFRLTLGRS